MRSCSISTAAMLRESERCWRWWWWCSRHCTVGQDKQLSAASAAAAAAAGAAAAAHITVVMHRALSDRQTTNRNRQRKCAENCNSNDTSNLFLNCDAHFALISNRNSFRVLFDKIAFVRFTWKNMFILLTLKMASPGNQHCANCIGTLSFPITTRLRSAVSRHWGSNHDLSASADSI